MRDRAWRRKKTESKWNSRCKKFMFDSTILDGNKEYSFNMSDVNGKKFRRTIIIPNYRKPYTWKEMKEKDPWAKYLRIVQHFVHMCQIKWMLNIQISYCALKVKSLLMMVYKNGLMNLMKVSNAGTMKN